MRKEGGFTLVEILLAAVIMTLGTLLLHQSYLRLADLYGRYVNGIRMESWMQDELWRSREALVYTDAPEAQSGSGTVQLGSKSFDWSRKVQLLSGRGLYLIRIQAAWLEGNRSVHLAREIFAFQKELA